LIYLTNYIFLFYRIFKEIYLKAPPILKDLSNNSVEIDYTESVQEQIDFNKSIYFFFFFNVYNLFINYLFYIKLIKNLKMENTAQLLMQ